MLNGVAYPEIEIQSTALHLISWEFSKSYKSTIFQKPIFSQISSTPRLKKQDGKPWDKTLENLLFCMISKTSAKLVVEGWVALFIAKPYEYVPGKL